MRDLLIVTCSRALQILTGLAALRLMTWLLSDYEIGRYSVFITSISLLALIFINPIGMYLLRYIHEWLELNLARVLVFSIFIKILLVVAVSSIILWLAKFYGFYLESYLQMAVILTHLFFVSTFNTLVPCINVMGYRLRWAIYSCSGLLLALIFSFLLASFIQHSAELWILGQVIGHLLVLVFVIYWMLFDTKVLDRVEGLGSQLFKYFTGGIKEFFLFSWPVSVTVFFAWLQLQSFRLFLGKLEGLEVLGLFAVAYAICAGIMASIETIAQQYYYPKFYKDVANASVGEQYRAWLEYARLMLPLITVFYFLVFIFADNLLVVFVDAKFHGISYFVYVAASIEYLRICSNIYASYMHAIKDTRQLLSPQIFGGVASVVLVPSSIYLFGVIGFSVSVLVSLMIYIYLLQRKIPPCGKKGFGQYLRYALVFSVLIAFLLGKEYLASFQVGLLGSFMILLLASVLALVTVFFIYRSITWQVELMKQ